MHFMYKVVANPAPVYDFTLTINWCCPGASVVLGHDLSGILGSLTALFLFSIYVDYIHYSILMCTPTTSVWSDNK